MSYTTPFVWSGTPVEYNVRETPILNRLDDVTSIWCVDIQDTYEYIERVYNTSSSIFLSLHFGHCLCVRGFLLGVYERGKTADCLFSSVSATNTMRAKQTSKQKKKNYGTNKHTVVERDVTRSDAGISRERWSFVWLHVMFCSIFCVSVVASLHPFFVFLYFFFLYFCSGIAARFYTTCTVVKHLNRSSWSVT